MSGLLVIVFALVAAQSVADALVGGAGLAVDTVGVDLQEHGDAVPSTVIQNLQASRPACTPGRTIPSLTSRAG